MIRVREQRFDSSTLIKDFQMRESHEFRISTREKLWKEQGGRCSYCNKTITKEQASLDHVCPINLTKKTNYDINGYVVTCKRCNKEKDNHIIFTNLYDRIVYPLVDIPYFFQSNYIQRNKFKHE